MKGKKFRTIIDIEDERKAKEREKFKKEVTEDIKDVFNGVFESGKKPIEKKKNGFLTILKWIGIIFLLLLTTNFILFNIWLIKFLVNNLFGI